MARKYFLVLALLASVTIAPATVLAKKPDAEAALLKQATAALDAKDWQTSVDALSKLVALDPNWDYYRLLGSADLNLGKYQEAIDAFDRGVAAAQADKKSPPKLIKAVLGDMLVGKGNALLKLGRNDDAVLAYEKAAAYASNPGLAYFNLCATQYNAGNMIAAIAACDKAILADPNRADAYFIKGSAMYGNGTLDSSNSYVVPPGTAEALRKYLELAPNGPHAADVRQMLDLLKGPVRP